MTEAEIHTLAGKIAALSPDEQAEFDRSLIGIKAELARREEERLAKLRALTDHQVVDVILAPANPDVDHALAILRDAGFVRGATLHEAYRAGYERYGYEHLGDGHPLQDEDAPDFMSARDYDLRELAKDRDVPAYMQGKA
ncbi:MULTISPECIES: hypothetical protein [unclassified Methylobacterium]|uniref:hypothetical protein n=1 Tax=unclassified Methylobacterium TaxID=2615210 RepID=UPI0005BAA373|nr:MULTISPECIES: hypothetical protein [unclassified Methylobacterium]SFU50377.1 hypothetical protein SAMN02799643_00950 [Methylobacterium sp. UNCCL125]